MLGGLGAYIASEIAGAIRRNTIVYGLYGFAVLLVLSAAGYGLNALHTVLSLHYGPVAASLWIGGGLLLAALLSFGTGLYLKTRPRPARPMAKTALVAMPIAAKLLGSGLSGTRVSWKTFAIAGVVIVGALAGRRFFAGDGDEDAGDEA